DIRHSNIRSPDIGYRDVRGPDVCPPDVWSPDVWNPDIRDISIAPGKRGVARQSTGVRYARATISVLIDRFGNAAEANAVVIVGLLEVAPGRQQREAQERCGGPPGVDDVVTHPLSPWTDKH
ncbi:MAG: hypothetical protein HY901_34210, partial [Deltaproteobacteria bacterium]|nr:hypothetical protein [Deltaproteobacteria bacterium]